MANRGSVKRPYFSHLPSETGCAGAGEGALHKAAKQILLESAGKVVNLGVGGHQVVLGRSSLEVPYPRIDRVVDVLSPVEFRRSERGVKVRDLELVGQADVVIEVMVTNAKDERYVFDMGSVGAAVYEKVVSHDLVYELRSRRSLSLKDAVRRCILTSSSGHWLSLAGLPTRVAGHVREYHGPPAALLNLASAALAVGKWRDARDMMRVPGVTVQDSWSEEDQARWVKGARRIADADPSRQVCPLCLGSKKSQYPTCWMCSGRR